MILELKQLNKSFDKPVLKDINLEIEQGQIISILGKSGSGKSTLLNVIAGFESAKSGSLHINGETIFDKKTNTQPEDRNIGFVFQNYALFPHLNVEKNLLFGVKDKKRKEKKSLVKELLEMIDLKGYEKKYPHELSGGEQQRVSLARVLATDPDIILLDEPFSSVDTLLKAQIEKELLALIKKSAKTAIFVTHDPKEAMAISDKIAFIQNGEIIQYDTPQNIYYQPKSKALASFFGIANFIDEECYRLNQISLSKQKGMYKAKLNHAIFRGEYYELYIDLEVNKKQYPFIVFDYDSFHTEQEFFVSLT
ncbi:ABC transporter ATP-binding protein [Sulfurimonas sp.]|uniref:ABC transporter ATP-binding protein n=1 Tax=Sulfurimonas sp. TaxID=2022749 RepID=UPI002B495C9D|nr:ABC transporter ATP-binding protein [Sulfurimonas sp.]